MPPRSIGRRTGSFQSSRTVRDPYLNGCFGFSRGVDSRPCHPARARGRYASRPRDDERIHRRGGGTRLTPAVHGAGDARHSKGLGTKSARHVDGRMTTRDDRRSGQPSARATRSIRSVASKERRGRGGTRVVAGRGRRRLSADVPARPASETGRTFRFGAKKRRLVRSPDARACAPPGRLDRIRSTRTSKGVFSVEATTRERARPCAGRQPALGGREFHLCHEQTSLFPGCFGLNRSSRSSRLKPHPRDRGDRLIGVLNGESGGHCRSLPVSSCARLDYPSANQSARRGAGLMVATRPRTTQERTARRTTCPT